MSFRRAKIRIEDAIFSEYIRRRDHCICKRCGKEFTPYRNKRNEWCCPGLQCSHFWGRGHWATRFMPENCDALCNNCHDIWEGEKNGDYRTFKINQLGQARYDLLETVAKAGVGKRDRKLALIQVKAMLADLIAKEEIDSPVFGREA